MCISDGILSGSLGSRALALTSENAYFLSKNMLENHIFFRGGSAPSTPARGLHGRPLGTPAGSFSKVAIPLLFKTNYHPVVNIFYVNEC